MVTKTIPKIQHPLSDMLDNQYELWKFFVKQAPGTAEHCKKVGDLCGKLANELGMDGVFLEVAGRYHDIGKTFSPKMFTENQTGKESIHDEINSPWLSSLIISRHVGDTLCILVNEKIEVEYHLRLLQIVSQHHGSAYTQYFLNKAEDEEDKSYFRYLGPRPQTREAALLLICDIFEAKGRSIYSNRDNVPSAQEFVNQLVEELASIQEGRKSQVGVLTLDDVAIIKKILTEEIHGTYHDRLDYDDTKENRKNSKNSLEKESENTSEE